MERAKTITIKAFRRMDSLSGNLRVEGGSRRRRGVRRLKSQACCRPPKELAGSDAESGMTAGGDATSCPAPTAGHKTDADPAKTKAKEAGRTPNKKGKTSKPGTGERKTGSKEEPPESLGDERAELDGGEGLPVDGTSFVDAVQEHIDLVRLTELLLRGRDERSSKSLLEQLLKMKYEKNAKVTESNRPLYVCDIPSAVTERAKNKETNQ